MKLFSKVIIETITESMGIQTIVYNIEFHQIVRFFKPYDCKQQKLIDKITLESPLTLNEFSDYIENIRVNKPTQIFAGV